MTSTPGIDPTEARATISLTDVVAAGCVIKTTSQLISKIAKIYW
jgi:hypothetical protein